MVVNRTIGGGGYIWASAGGNVFWVSTGGKSWGENTTGSKGYYGFVEYR